MTIWPENLIFKPFKLAMWKVGATMNQRLLIGYEQTLIVCGSDILVLVFGDTAKLRSF